MREAMKEQPRYWYNHDKSLEGPRSYNHEGPARDIINKAVDAPRKLKTEPRLAEVWPNKYPKPHRHSQRPRTPETPKRRSEFIGTQAPNLDTLVSYQYFESPYFEKDPLLSRMEIDAQGRWHPVLRPFTPSENSSYYSPISPSLGHRRSGDLELNSHSSPASNLQDAFYDASEGEIAGHGDDSSYPFRDSSEEDRYYQEYKLKRMQEEEAERRSAHERTSPFVPPEGFHSSDSSSSSINYDSCDVNLEWEAEDRLRRPELEKEKREVKAAKELHAAARAPAGFSRPRTAWQLSEAGVGDAEKHLASESPSSFSRYKRSQNARARIHDPDEAVSFNPLFGRSEFHHKVFFHPAVTPPHGHATTRSGYSEAIAHASTSPTSTLPGSRTDYMPLPGYSGHLPRRRFEATGEGSLFAHAQTTRATTKAHVKLSSSDSHWSAAYSPSKLEENMAWKAHRPATSNGPAAHQTSTNFMLV